MTIREMIDAMLAGKTLVRPNGAKAYYDPDDADCRPWVYVGFKKERMVNGWDYPDWSIKPEPKKRPMTREEVIGFCINTPGIVVRFDKVEWGHPGMMDYSWTPNDYDWAIMNIKGRIIGGPHTFDVSDERR